MLRLRIFKNRILRQIFEPKRDVNGEWGRLTMRNFIPFKSRLRWAGHVARMEEGRSAFKILKGKSTGKGPLRRPRHRWEDNFRIDLEEIGNNAEVRDYWRALLNAALNLRVP